MSPETSASTPAPPEGEDPEGDAAADAARTTEQEREGPETGDVGAPVEADEATAEVPAEIADEVGQALALREQAVSPVSSIPLPAEWNALEVMANRLAHSRVVPEAYRGRPDDVIAAWLYGRELGLGQMTALRDIYMVDGRAAVAAHRQLGLLRTGGVRIIESEATDERAYIVAQRVDTAEIMTVEFTMEEAARIRRKGKPLVDGDNWKNYPKDMLWARCVGRLSRRLGPDLLGGLPPYVAEEIADFSGWGVEYGGDNALSISQGQGQQQRQASWTAPKSWRELGERCARVLGQAEWDEWRIEILELGWEVDRVADIGDTDEAFRSFQMFLRAIEAWEPKHEIDPIPRSVVQEAAKAAFKEIEVEGPDWRLTPDETERDPRATPGIPETSAAKETQVEEEQIEDAVIVEDVVADEDAVVVDPSSTESGEAELGVLRQELSDEIDKLLITIDKKRKGERGTTYRELIETYGTPSEIAVSKLEEALTNLRAYAQLSASAMGDMTFDEFCATEQQIEFGA